MCRHRGVLSAATNLFSEAYITDRHVESIFIYIAHDHTSRLCLKGFNFRKKNRGKIWKISGHHFDDILFDDIYWGIREPCILKFLSLINWIFMKNNTKHLTKPIKRKNFSPPLGLGGALFPHRCFRSFDEVHLFALRLVSVLFCLQPFRCVFDFFMFYKQTAWCSSSKRG